MPTAANKTVQSALSTLATNRTSGSVTMSTPVDVSTKLRASFAIQLARLTGSAFTAGWPNVRIEKSMSASDAGPWIPMYSYQMSVGASIVNTTINGAITAGATSMIVNLASNIQVGDILFLSHTTTSANRELVRVKAVSGTTITFEEACANAHDNGAQVTDQAEVVSVSFDLEAEVRTRTVIDNAGSGQDIACAITMITEDSVG